MYVRWRLPRRLGFRITGGGFGEEVANRKGEKVFCVDGGLVACIFVQYGTVPVLHNT